MHLCRIQDRINMHAHVTQNLFMQHRSSERDPLSKKTMGKTQ